MSTIRHCVTMTDVSQGLRLRWSGSLLLSALACGVPLAGCSQEPAAVTVPAQSKEELERAKLAAETRGVEAKTARDGSVSASLLQWAPFATAVVALIGVGVTLRGQLRERRTERRRRHDEELARTVQNLGSDTARMRLNAGAALSAFLGPNSPEFHADLLAVIIANLKIETDSSVADVLVRDLETALRQCLRDSRPTELDLSRAPWLVRLDLHDVDLSGIPVDIAFANLTRANLTDLSAPRTVRGWGAILDHARLSRANLHEARLNQISGVGAVFHRSRLVSATFKRADLRQARFQQADLQGAQFTGATLTGAVFTDADIADARFYDARTGYAAVLDDGALRSLAHTRNRSWERAWFSPVHRYAVAAHAGELNAFPAYAARLVRRGALRAAADWYQKALDAGVALAPNAMRRLGEALLPQDRDAGYTWLQRAAERGDPEAIATLDQQ